MALTLPSASPQCDKLAADCAHELRRHGVSCVSLWPGIVQTELLKEHMAKEEVLQDSVLKQVGKGRAKEAENRGVGLCILNNKTITRSDTPTHQVLTVAGAGLSMGHTLFPLIL